MLFIILFSFFLLVARGNCRPRTLHSSIETEKQTNVSATRVSVLSLSPPKNSHLMPVIPQLHLRPQPLVPGQNCPCSLQAALFYMPPSTRNKTERDTSNAEGPCTLIPCPTHAKSSLYGDALVWRCLAEFDGSCRKAGVGATGSVNCCRKAGKAGAGTTQSALHKVSVVKQRMKKST